MHILLIPSWYSTPRNPNRGMFFYAQAQALRKAGHQVGMLVPPSRLRTLHGLREVQAYWRRSNDDLTITDQGGVPVYRIAWWGWLPSVLPSRRAALGLAAFDRYVAEQGKPDIIHGHGILYGGYLAALIGRARGIPSVVTEHNSMFSRRVVQPGQMRYVRETLRLADKLLAVSPALAKAIQPFTGGRSIALLGNVVDTELFQLPAAPPPDSPFVVATVGNLDANKSQDVLLRAFASAFKGQAARLDVVGEGRERAALEQLSRELGIQPQVSFKGRLPPPEVCRILQQAHAVASTSTVETFGVSLIEAMACGKPVLATRSGGPEFFVDDRNGILVNVADVEAVAAGLQTLRTNLPRYDSAAIRRACVERFSEAAIVRQLEAIYTALLTD